MSDRTEFLDPEFEPGEFDRIERQLRTALAEDARRLDPGNRLDAILHEAHEAGPVTATGGSGGPRRWLVPVAAAAAVAAIITGVWWSNQQPEEPAPPATTGPSLTSPPSSPSATTPSQTATSSTTSEPVQTRSTALPVYFVGPQGDAKPTYRLFREFLRRDLPETASAADLAKAALEEALDAQRFSNTDGYLQPWSGQRILSVRQTPQLITVDLENAGNPQAAVTPEVRRLAVQQLVWTAQAAVQAGNVPVRFTVQGGQAQLFGSISTDQTFTRPPSDQLYEDIAAIWVTSPGRDEVLPAGKPVVVKGSAIVFEANVTWELRRGSTRVKSGHATATVGAPMQGTWSIDLGTLSAGTYSLRVFELSAENGTTVQAEVTRTFTVR